MLIEGKVEEYIVVSGSHALHDPLDSFTDREQILDFFEQFLRLAQSNQFRLLAVKGNSGTGKTFLIDYLAERVCPKQQWQSGRISFVLSKPDFRSILGGVEEAIESCVQAHNFKQYTEQRDEYYRRFDEYRASISISQSIEASNQSTIIGVNQSIQIYTPLRERELQLRYELTEALKELCKAMHRPLCLFIDGYERLAESDPELIGWLWEQVLFRLAKAASQPFLIMTCGWDWPTNPAIKPFSHSTELTDFDLKQVRSYLEKQDVIRNTPDVSSPEDQKLVATFYQLTKGHPLVLALATTYYNALEISERIAKNLLTNRPLVDSRAQVELLEERLLSRLPEPHRTLLEWGPILRSFNQASLQVLLHTSTEHTAPEIMTLDDRTYNRFLRYPFINQIKQSGGNGLRIKLSFHELVRKVQLGYLRLHHPQTKEKLHRSMVEYYKQLAASAYSQETARQEPDSRHYLASFGNKYEHTKRLAEMSYEEFSALVEGLYHALQIKEMQTTALEEWLELIEDALRRWDISQAAPLLMLGERLAEEGESFFSWSSNPYGRYLQGYSLLLEQQARWEEAIAVAKKAVQLYEQLGDPDALAVSLNNVGALYENQGKLDQAISYLERAVLLIEQKKDAVTPGILLNNIGENYLRRGKPEQALGYFKRALELGTRDPSHVSSIFNNLGRVYHDLGDLQPALVNYRMAQLLREQVGNPIALANTLNNIGQVFLQREDSERALRYFERASALYQRGGEIVHLPFCLMHIGDIYRQQERLELALVQYKQALTYFERRHDLISFARCLKRIGGVYSQQKELEQALGYHKQALNVFEQEGDLVEIADILGDIAGIYLTQRKLEQALQYYKRALDFNEQADNPAGIALSLNIIGSIYDSKGQPELALKYFKQAVIFYEQTKHLIALVSVLCRIGDIYREQNLLEEALQYYKRALHLDEQASNSAHLAESLNGVGLIYYLQGKFELALEHFQRALLFLKQKNDVSTLDTYLTLIGIIYEKQGKLEQALEYFEQAVPLKEQIGDAFELAVTLNKMGVLYRRVRKLEQALKCHEQALSLRIQIGNVPDIALSLNNMGTVYGSLGNMEHALKYYEQALALREQTNNLDEIAQSLNNVGRTYYAQGNLDQARSYFERTLSLLERIDNPLTQALSLNNIGGIYYAQGNLEQARSYFERALALFEKTDAHDEFARCLVNIGEIYNAQNEFEMARSYWERALIFLKQADASEDIALCLNCIGSANQELKEWGQAIERYLQALNLYVRLGRGFEAEVAEQLEALATCYSQLGEPEKSSDCKRHAERIRKAIQHPL